MTLTDLDAQRDFRNEAAAKYENGGNEADRDSAILHELALQVQSAARAMRRIGKGLDVARDGNWRHPVSHLATLIGECVADDLRLTPEAARVFMSAVRVAS